MGLTHLKIMYSYKHLEVVLSKQESDRRPGLSVPLDDLLV